MADPTRTSLDYIEDINDHLDQCVELRKRIDHADNYFKNKPDVHIHGAHEETGDHWCRYTFELFIMHRDKLREAHRRDEANPREHWAEELPLQYDANMRILLLERRLRYVCQGFEHQTLPADVQNLTIFKGIEIGDERDSEKEGTDSIHDDEEEAEEDDDNIPMDVETELNENDVKHGDLPTRKDQMRWRSGVAGRLIWILDPASDEAESLRYSGYSWKYNVGEQKDILAVFSDHKHDWLFFPEEGEINLEWMALIKFVGALTLYEVDCLETIDDVFHRLRKARALETKLTGVEIDKHARAATNEAYNAGTTHCPICLNEFLKQERYEPAVKTNCGHFIGKDCLREWLESGEENCNRCPECRGYYLDAVTNSIAFLPDDVKDAANAYIDFFGEDCGLENAVDNFLVGDAGW